jgi:hypothetical protein
MASLCLVAGALVTVRGPSSSSPGAAPTTSLAESSEPSTSTSGPEEPAPSGGDTSTSTSSTSTSTTVNPGFVDGQAASMAAEQLLVPYIASEQSAEVTEPACSQPPTGAVGETFACYALKPGDLVIALRATIGEDRLITLELITDQVATTSTVPAEATDTTSP